MGARQLLLLTCAVGAVMGRPGKWELPSIPAGRRAEYYVQTDDGNYRFGYDTGEGQYHREDGTQETVEGEFGFISPEGRDVKVEYTADGAGFIVHGSDALALAGGFGQRVTGSGSSSGYSASASSRDFTSAESSSSDSDASYSFAFDAEDHSRSESSDAVGNVKGQFAFVADDGVNRAVSYEAGADKGFIAVGDHLPRPAEVDAGFGLRVAGSQASSSNSIVRGGPVVQPAPSSTYLAPARPVYPQLIQRVSPIRPVPVVSLSPQSTDDQLFDPNADPSYSFDFQSDEYTRSEAADASGKVTGQYSFVTAEGQLRTITYEAGEGIGFLIKGDTLSDLDAATLARIRQAAAQRIAQQSSHSFSGDVSTGVQTDVRAGGQIDVSAGVHTVGTSYAFDSTGRYRPSGSAETYQTSNVAYSSDVAAADSSEEYDAAANDPLFDPNADPSYSFAFVSDEHSRDETADSSGTIRGQYSFVTSDGKRRTISYIAGSDTGFVIQADSVSDVDAATLARIQEAAATRAKLQQYTLTHQMPAATINADGSYTISYDAQTHSRFEQGDTSNNVDGRFTFTADDGVDRSVSYTAGADTGFVATGSHLPVPVLSETITVVGDSTFSARPYSVGSPVKYPAGSSSLTEYRPEDDPYFDSQADRSYSFDFASDEHSRSETANSDGTVTGYYSLITADGKKRTITYKSGADIGFEVVSDVVTDVDAATLDRVRAAAAQREASAVHSQQTAPQIPSGSFGYSYQVPISPAVAVPKTVPAIHSQQTSAQTPSGSFGYSYQVPALPAVVVPKAVPAAIPASLTHSLSSVACDDAVRSDSADLSYSFSYDAGDHSRQESADASGNVVGQYSFLTPDGVRRTVAYSSDGSQGYTATGDIIPKAPAVPSAASSRASYTASDTSGASRRTSTSSAVGTRSSTNMAMPLEIRLPNTIVQRGFQHVQPEKFGYSFVAEE